ncbi:hypothetical protein CRUP_023109 [Coryphaenoides rupestris]|nr:hypothetical protein CRUP_023109 [Coryphaenoides rupestris]
MRSPPAGLGRAGGPGQSAVFTMYISAGNTLPCMGHAAVRRSGQSAGSGSITCCSITRCSITLHQTVSLMEEEEEEPPAADCESRQDVYNKVMEQRVMEPLPADCPDPLRHLIDSCRSYDDFLRPSAGVLVDKLHRIVDQLDEE